MLLRLTRIYLEDSSTRKRRRSFLGIIIFVFAAKRRQPNSQQDKQTTTKASSKGNLVTDLDIFLDCLNAADCVLHVFGYFE
jgi:hypothetical protein